MPFEVLPTGHEARKSNYEKIKNQILGFSDDANMVWDNMSGSTKVAAKTALTSLPNWDAESVENQVDHLLVVVEGLLIFCAGLTAEIEQLKAPLTDRGP